LFRSHLNGIVCQSSKSSFWITFFSYPRLIEYTYLSRFHKDCGLFIKVLVVNERDLRENNTI